MISNVMLTRNLLLRFPMSIACVALAFTASCGAHKNSQIKNSSYSIRGVRYVPYSVDAARDYDEIGMASWYGSDGFFGKETTANGEKVTGRSLSGAHKLLPLPSTVEVTNLANGKRVRVRINDR